MQKIIFLKGLPASGKSTWSKQYCKDNINYKRLNKDDIREFLGNPPFTFEFEKIILNTQRIAGEYLIKQGFSIIIDDTNFSKKHYNFWLKKARDYSLEFEQKMFDTPMEECIKRDELREKSVGKDVILKMAETYLK